MNLCRDQASNRSSYLRQTLTRNSQSSSYYYLIKLRLEAQSSCLRFLIYGLQTRHCFVGYERAPLVARAKNAQSMPDKSGVVTASFTRCPPYPLPKPSYLNRIVSTFLECEGTYLLI